MLDDLDAIAAESDGPVYINTRWSPGYLYLGGKYSPYSTWYVAQDADRQEEYWRLHPDRAPECVYIPFYHGSLYVSVDLTLGENSLADSVAYAQSLGENETVKGRAGYIVKY